MRRPAVVLSAGVAAVLVLAGCGSGAGADSGADDRISVVASTDVYGQIAAEIGGDSVAVTSLITSASQDPHSYEASARDQLTVSRADVVIDNGGGYDPFVDALIASSDSKAAVITAIEYSASPEQTEGEHGHVEGFNEHVWYDLHTVERVAEAIVAELSALRPEDADTLGAHGDSFLAQIAGLESELEKIAAAHGGESVFVTEPVPLYLVAAAGLDNITPDAFTEAVEEGQDVPPATLLNAMNLLDGGDVAVVVVNAQTGGAETTRVIDEADAAGIPVVEFTETLPEGETYISWMQSNIDALAGALNR